LMPEYSWASVVVLLEYGCFHCPMDCDL
jgi:hypothetical protein